MAIELIGRELRGIKVMSRLGAGGMGTVYHGRVIKPRRNLQAGTDVAVKILHPELSADGDAVSRFKMEAGLGLTLNHPNIVRIYQVGSERIEGAQIHFLIQEFLGGITLKSLIEDVSLLSDLFLRQIARQIAGALCEIHDRGVIHRDLKPENVFLETDGTVKLVDFGFSHVEKGLRSRESGSHFLGTVAYAAPERFGAAPATRSSDLYSLGVILYELAVGENPFLWTDLTSTIANHLDLVPEEPNRRAPYLTPFMSFLILALLEKRPKLRLGPSSRLVRILEKGESSRWWRSVRPDRVSGTTSLRRRVLHVARRTPVFGRRREVTRMLQSMDEVIEGKGSRVICLLGESGSGKTRLADHMLEELDQAEKPGRVLLMEGAQGSVKIPYLPLISALQSAFSMQDLQRDALRRGLEKKMKAYFPDRSKIFARFTRLLISNFPDQGPVEETLHPEMAAQLFIEIFRALAREEPLILMMENVADADAHSFSVVMEMIRHFGDAAILLIMTLKPGGSAVSESGERSRFNKLLEAMTGTENSSVIELLRLDRSSVSQILCNLGFPEKVANGPFGERVFTLSEGNPYFVLEIARWVESTNRVASEEVDWHSLQLEIPSSIQDIFYRRLFRISPLERRFLEFASVIGRRFRVEAVMEGLGLDFKEAAQTVSRLQNQHALIRPGNGFYRFDHLLIRDLLYNTIDPADRAHYHCRAGAHYAALARKRNLTGRECYRAAVHFSRGRDHRLALQFFQKAFDYLRYKHSHVLAYRLAGSAAFHLKALRRSGEEPEPAFVCDLFLKQAEVADFLGKRAIQFSALKKALQAALISDVPALMARVRLRIGQYYHGRSRLISAITFIESALSRMRKAGDLRGEAEALQSLSMVLQDMGDTEQVIGLLRKAYALMERLDDGKGQASILVDMGDYYLDRSKPVAAREALVKARRLYRKLKDERGFGLVLLGLGKIDLQRNAFREAEEALEEAGRIAYQVGDVALESDVCRALGTCRWKRSIFDRADGAFEKALQLAATIHDAGRQTRVLEAQIRMLIDEGYPTFDPERALHKAREAVARSRDAALNPESRAAALVVLALVYERLDRPLSAFAIYRKADRLLRENGGPDPLLRECSARLERVARVLGKSVSKV